MQPAGEYLGEEYYRAGGVPAVMAELIEGGKIHEGALTVNGRTMGENCRGKTTSDRQVIRSCEKPLRRKAGFLNLKGNLFDSAIMKTSVISKEFHDRYLSNPKDPNAFEGPVVVFDGPEDYHHRIDDPALGIDEHTILIMRGAGPIGYPGRRRGRQHAAARRADPQGRHLAALHRRRPPVRHLRHALDPQRLAGGGSRRRPRPAADRRPHSHRPQQAHGRHPVCRPRNWRSAARISRPAAATPTRRARSPWQEIQRSMVDQLSEGMVLKPAVKYQRIAQSMGVPRDNH